MQLKRQKVKLKLKECKYSGCKKAFLGHPISKYCEFHRNIKNREKKNCKKQDVSENNRIIDHDNKMIINETLRCGLKGCRTKYTIEILPKVFVYPKYCLEHRNAFKRDNFLRMYVKTKKEENQKIESGIILKSLIKNLKLPDNVNFKETSKFVILKSSFNKKYRIEITGNVVRVSEKNYKDFENITEEERRKRHLGIVYSEKRINTIEEFEEVLYHYFENPITHTSK